jgi:hypothetical protein
VAARLPWRSPSLQCSRCGVVENFDRMCTCLYPNCSHVSISCAPAFEIEIDPFTPYHNPCTLHPTGLLALIADGVRSL